MLTLTQEEQQIFDRLNDSSSLFNNDSQNRQSSGVDGVSPDPMPDLKIEIEETCPTDLVPNILEELKSRLGNYVKIIDEYKNVLISSQEGKSRDEEYNPYLEYERLRWKLDETLSKISSNNDIASSIYTDCICPLITFGMYTPRDNKIHLFVGTIRNYANQHDLNPAHLLATVYIHECFHAYVNRMAKMGGKHYVREIEEPMAECYMLCYFKDKFDKTQNTVFSDIYQLACKTVKGKQHGLTAAYGFGYYIHDFTSNDPKFLKEKLKQQRPIDICIEYAHKAKLIDHSSINVIRYCLELMLDYPAASTVPQEGEKGLFGLLVNQILNIGQKQELSFVDLYTKTKAELKSALLEKWQPKNAKFDSSYQGQIEGIIEETVSENILVENMSPWQSATPVYKSGIDYTQLIDQRLLSFLPYEHQVKCWNALRANGTTYKSMVVTTGTGSGKTESFMVPLISDLANSNATGLKAIFLYPLNALMEDQKKKLNDMIESSGSNLTFAVYNGSSPYMGTEPFGAGEDRGRFKHELVYREEIRGEASWDSVNACWQSNGVVPDIILTNPTMLEYMLLRRSDKAIIDRSQQQLSWIVIDETHSYNGAGAAELGMLIRRVLKAFDRNADDIHFATSSATVGDSDQELLTFISNITGQDCQKIKIIKGHRSLPDFSLATTPNNSKTTLLAQLANNDYVYLKGLIPYESTTVERLRELDRLCVGGLKVKVHFFVEALTNGLFSNMEDIMNGANVFSLTPKIPFDSTSYRMDSRFLTAMHCTKCGAILASALVNPQNEYSRSIVPSDKTRFFAINDNTTPQPNASFCDILPNNRIAINQNNGSLLLSADCSCPRCGAKNTDSQWEIRPFNVSSSSCMRSLSPVLLKNASAHSGQLPYFGKQFISFADSRRGAAEPSLQQNLETEKRWVIGVLLSKLYESFSYDKVSQVLDNRSQDARANGNTAERQRLLNDILELENANAANDKARIIAIATRNNIDGRLSWDAALDALYSECDQYAKCFAKKTDWDSSQGCLKEEYRRQYALAALYNTMKSRSKERFSPESYGMLRVEYAGMDSIIQLPNEVKTLNDVLSNLGYKTISVDDWKDFLKIYLDFHVRTNENLFFKSSSHGWNTLDIKDCRNLQTTYGKRRSIKDPIVTEGIHKKLLWRLFGCDNIDALKSLNASLQNIVDGVVSAMWRELMNCGLIEEGHTFYKAYGQTIAQWNTDVLTDNERKKEHRTNFRLNVTKISFSLLEDAFREENVKVILDTTFQGHSPYQEEYRTNHIQPSPLTGWSPKFPSDDTDLQSFYDNHGVPYLYCSLCRDIYSKEPLFIQYEHTAQVGRELTKSRIEDFKDHKINILACSTTMEMGVDIGELEIVTMSNIPPHPANYKQRVGRAGRAFQNKSASVTVCNSDAVGISVMDKPKENLLEGTIATPSADLNSPQVVQRHINSYLLRKYLVGKKLPSVFANRSIRNFELVDFFFDSKFEFDPSRITPTRRHDLMDGTTKITPDQYNNTFHDNSLYKGFLNWLLTINGTVDPGLWADLDLLKTGTALGATANEYLVDATRVAIMDLFNSFESELLQIQRNASTGNNNFNWNTLTGYAGRLYYDFMGLIRENLIIYCSTHQFTPNANMPVNIVKLKIRQKDEEDESKYSNPSRDLVVALTEYAPGKSVVIDGKSYTIGGVDWDRGKAFRRIHICKDCGYTWENGQDAQCPSCGNTNVSHHNLIEPTAFLPEQETDRIIDKASAPSSVKAELIGANGIHMQALTPLCDYDVELPNADTKILYMNDGIGFGYCVCKTNDCGRAVAESQMKSQVDQIYLRNLMYSKIDPVGPNQLTTYEHQNLNTFQQDYFTPEDLERNMIIGGSISTNYSILKPYKVGHHPFEKSEEDDAILTTLGLIVCEELSKSLPCQRQDIDFLISTINRGERVLCIYDTAKGGAGYSSYLKEPEWKNMLNSCRKKLSDIINKVKPVESLFSRYTIKYLERINILATYSWLTDEFNSRQPIPQAIVNRYNGAVQASISDIASRIRNAHDATLYVQADISNWNYELPDSTIPSWKDMRGIIKRDGSQKTELAFCGDPGVIPVEAVDIIKHSEDWANFSLAPTDPAVFPLAYIDGTLFVTDDATTACYNGLWGSGSIFVVQTNKPATKPFTPTLSSFSEFFIPANTKLASSKDLLDLLLSLNSSNEIADFIRNANGHTIKIIYMDEHMKTQLGLIIIVQFIEAITKRMGCNDFTVRFINEEFYECNGKTIDNPYRSLTDSFQTADDCNEILDKLLQNLGWEYSIETKDKKSLPHWRSLVIKDVDANCALTIKPHGGFANGWYIDTETAKKNRVYYGVNNSDASSDIPIASNRENEIEYTVGLK